jgi:predicted metal-dependent peptidase
MADKIDIELTKREAKAKMDQIALSWFTSDPIMLDCWCMVEKQTNPNQKTIGINLFSKHPSIDFNPLFINKINTEQLEAVMASEMFKILLRHCTTRLRDPRQISSLSSNITINQLMINELKNIMGDISQFLPSPEMFKLNPGLFFEEYYRQLMDQVNKTNDMIKQIWNSMSKEEKEDMIQKAMSGQGESKEGEGQPQDGQGESKEGEGQPQDGQGQGFKDFENHKDALKDYYDPNGTSNDGWGKNDMFDSDINNFINSKKDSVRHWGKHTGNCMAEIIAANEPKISYKEVVKRFARSVLMGESITSRMKVNRRYDIAMPGYRRKYKSKIIFAIDISGSMSDADIAEGFSIVNSCCKHADITWITFDTEIKSIEKNYKKARKAFKLNGRGGTEVSPVLEYAKEQKCDGLVIFSDMCFSTPHEPKHLKVLWLSHSQGQEPPCSWGFKAALKRFDDFH